MGDVAFDRLEERVPAEQEHQSRHSSFAFGMNSSTWAFKLGLRGGSCFV